ncbi:50S ribosomal protein L4 [Candidatus Giovannonibacteria bacterium RIFCSPHIGHO2_02_42_15]|uniref:Large ribosomal subunit protein uL4 n=2 Tax=Candidatus Giovannoniibacteriota TaxID=1752738 RepID=A0A1F5VK24_9BACT|nr:MAG: 50S ribosomal protein L4 [Candidatus Giovannonibacteria bacterium GW2011_GWF2_42_19]OGF63809.1 MAG: 50S ribosomal protein L4 [Candidatus Giovannonibacteria bacterium RIFCSPHIGHO2_02_42_15]
MPKIKVYNQDGKDVGELELSDKLFAVPWNPDLVHQVVSAERANLRTPIAHTKDRAEVRGGGKKPWRQKGTGRARHGSSRSPIWIGGGITHGPRKDRNYSEKINKKMKRKAVFTVLSQKIRDNEVVFLDELKITQAKTKIGAGILKNLSKIKGFENVIAKSVIVAVSRPDRNIQRALRNIKNVELIEARNLNPLEIISSKFLVLPQESAKILEKTFAS